MLLEFEPNPGTPLYSQIAASIRRTIREGKVSDGDRLPATRDLATSLGVNMHTVVRAYGVLRDEGLIEMRRGRGAIIRAGSADTAEISHLVKELAALARHQGVGVDEVVTLITKEFS